MSEGPPHRAFELLGVALALGCVGVLRSQRDRAQQAHRLAERRLAALDTSNPEAADAVRWRHQALHDELTHLANRGGLFESLELLDDPKSEGGRTCAVLYTDLDGFKGINDTYGHAAGDQFLVAMADRLRGLVRPGDTVARLGGDEFVLVIERVADPAGALEIAERVRKSLSAPVMIGGCSVAVTASFGIAVGGEHSASALLGQADGALYEAKRTGRNRCCVWTPALGLPSGASFSRRRADP